MKSIIKKLFAGGTVLLLLIIVSIIIFWEKLPIRLVWPYLNQQEISIGGSVEKITILGENGGEQTFFVYLPKGYENSDKEFPVLYHLHGAFTRESWVEYETQFLGSKVEQAVADGIVESMIIVSPFDPEGKIAALVLLDAKISVLVFSQENIYICFSCRYTDLFE